MVDWVGEQRAYDFETGVEVRISYWPTKRDFNKALGALYSLSERNGWSVRESPASGAAHVVRAEVDRRLSTAGAQAEDLIGDLWTRALVPVTESPFTHTASLGSLLAAGGTIYWVADAPTVLFLFATATGALVLLEILHPPASALGDALADRVRAAMRRKRRPGKDRSSHPP